jgi:dihydrofolate synthase/folylpolyglutamate synthase
VIDGAHSPESTAALANAIRSHFPKSRVTIVFGMLNDKLPDQVIPPLESIVDRWIVAPLQSPRTLPVEPIVSSLESRGGRAESSASIAAALGRALDAWTPSPENRIVVVAGSLTAAAEARVALGLA